MAVESKTESGDALVVTTRELARKAGQIIRSIRENQRSAIITGRDGFAAILQPLNTERINRLVLESVSELTAARTVSEKALSEGKTTTATELASELGIELHPGSVALRRAARTPRAVKGTPGKVAAKASKAHHKSTQTKRAAR